jgi:hypothetical protein
VTAGRASSSNILLGIHRKLSLEIPRTGGRDTSHVGSWQRAVSPNIRTPGRSHNGRDG